MFRFGLAFGLASLALFSFMLFAQPGIREIHAEALLWQDDGYPPPEDTSLPPPDEEYPPPEETTEPPGGEYPPPEGEATQEPSLTPALSPTSALIDQTQPPGAETITPSPMATGQTTAAVTATPAASAQVSAEAEPVNEPKGFQVDWGFFWIGFAVPILAGSGVVLYLLDRRPDLFRPRSKL